MRRYVVYRIIGYDSKIIFDKLLQTIKRKNHFERLRSTHHHCDRFRSQTILTIILQIFHKTNLGLYFFNRDANKNKFWECI